MHTRTAARLTLAGMVIFGLILIYATVQLRQLGEDVRFLVGESKKPVQTITQQITRRDGTTVTLVTTRITHQDGTHETILEWRRRHDHAVSEFKNT